MADTVTIQVQDSLGVIAQATFTLPPALAATTPTFSPIAGNYAVTQSVAISADPGAVINYTTDGSTPTPSSAVYSSPLSVSVNETLKAIANVSGYLQSAVGSASYVIGALVATPTFNPVAGTYGGTQSVTISTTTPSPTIYFTTDGSTPTTGSTVYAGPISVAASETVKAIATATGFLQSAVGSAAYVISAGGLTPVFNFASFNSGIVPSQVFVVTNSGGLSGSFISLINANSGHSSGGAWYQTIQDISLGFTTDFTFQFVGSTATAGGLPNVSGLTFAVQNDARGPTIGGDANSDGYGSFPEFSGNIPIRNSAGVKFSMANGGGNYFNRPTGRINGTGCYFNGGFADCLVPYNDIQPYGIDMNAGNVMHGFVTYDGTILTMVLQDTVTLAQARYSWPVNIPTFLGQNTGYVGFGAGNVSNVQIKLLSWVFARKFNARLATPTFSVTPGQYTSGQSVAISGPGSIFYTTNGLEPSTSSTLYSGSVSIAANTILKAIAIQSGFTDSFVATGTYQIAAGGTPLINFPSGFASSAGLLNLVGRAAISGSSVVLTDGTQPPSAGEVGGMWYPAAVPTSSFTASFQFNLAAGNARGFCFVLQNVPASSTSISGSTGGPFALSWGTAPNGNGNGMGAGGSGINNAGGNLTLQQTLGFAKSVILAIGPIGGSGSWCGVFTNGAQPTTAGSTSVSGTLNFQSGHNFRADLSYSGGTTLNVTITDLTTSVALPLTFTVNIASIVGAAGFAGFTGADFGGGAQKINTWTM